METTEQLVQQNKKPDKLTDKAFLRLAVTSILAILVCIVCLCSTTFAWFKDSAPSTANSIKTADECDLSVQISKLPASSTDAQDDETSEEPTTEESEVSEETPDNPEDSPATEENSIEAGEQSAEPELVLLEGTPDADGNGTVYNLTAGEYIVTLSLPGNTASGYCKIIVGDKTYYTDYVLRHTDAEPHTLTFKLVVEENTPEVNFVPHWGIFTRDSDIVDGVMTISAHSTQNN